MYTAEQVLNGIIKYADNEVLSKLDTKGKIFLGTGITIAMQNASTILKQIPQNDIVKMLGIVDDGGQYDVDLVATHLKENAKKYGKIQFNIPVVGTLTFTPEDVDKLKDYIEGVA